MSDRLDWVLLICKLLFWFLSIWAIYWLILKVTGHSPTAVEIMIVMQSITLGFLVAIIIFLFKFYGEFRSLDTKVSYHIRECDRRFYALAKDFKKCRQENCS